MWGQGVRCRTLCQGTASAGEPEAVAAWGRRRWSVRAQPGGCGLGSLRCVRSTLSCGQQVQLSQTGARPVPCGWISGSSSSSNQGPCWGYSYTQCRCLCQRPCPWPWRQAGGLCRPGRCGRSSVLILKAMRSKDMEGWLPSCHDGGTVRTVAIREVPRDCCSPFLGESGFLRNQTAKTAFWVKHRESLQKLLLLRRKHVAASLVLGVAA